MSEPGLTEDEAVAALQEALQFEVYSNPRERYVRRALLDRVRWLCAHEWAEDGYCCPECKSRNYGTLPGEQPPTHDPSCSVGLWTRAAKRVGLC